MRGAWHEQWLFADRADLGERFGDFVRGRCPRRHGSTLDALARVGHERNSLRRGLLASSERDPDVREGWRAMMRRSREGTFPFALILADSDLPVATRHDHRIWRLFETTAERVIRTAGWRRFPGGDRRAQDFRESLPHWFVGKGMTPGHRDVAVRIVQASPESSIGGLCRWLAAHPSEVAALLAPPTACQWLDLVFPEVGGRGVQRRLLAEAVADDPEMIARMHDLRVAHRFVDALDEAEADAILCAARTSQRIAGRLRALIIQQGPDTAELLSAVAASSGLWGREARAVDAYVRRLARDEQYRGFPMDTTRPATRPVALGETPNRLQIQDVAPLRAWLLKGTLRVGIEKLVRWITTGSTCGRDSRLGAWLCELPDAYVESGVKRRYHGIRSWFLADDRFGAMAGELMPAVRTIAQVAPGRSALSRIRDAIAPQWHPAITMPRGGAPRMIEHAKEAVEWYRED